MRVLQVSMFYAEVGGAELYMHALTRRLAERGHEVSFFGGSSSEDVTEDARRVVRRPDFDKRRLIEDPRLAEAFRDHAQRFRPEVIHVHNLSHFPAAFPRELERVGVPAVMTVHDYSLICPNAWCVLPDGTKCEGGVGAKCFQHGCEENYPYDARIVAAAHVRELFVKRAFSRFLVPSRALFDRCRAHGFEPTEHLPYFADEDHLASPERRRELEGVQRDPHEILFLGRLDRTKGVTYLLQAMPSIRAEVPEARLTVVGDGVEMDALREEATRLGLDDCVTFRGKIPHTEVPGVLARCAVNVLPSIWSENSPVGCYESFVFGTPMVASDVGGLPDLVREGVTGFVARPRDPADLAEKVTRVLKDAELRRELSANARRELARYAPEAHLQRVEEVYTELLGAPALARGDAGPAEDEAAIVDRFARHLANVEDHVVHLESQTGGRVRRAVNRALDGAFSVWDGVKGKNRA